MMSNAANTLLQNERVAFLVGAGLSGTTLLYKLLCLHPQIGFITNYENRSGWLKDGLACRAVSWRLEDKLRAWFKENVDPGDAKSWRLEKLFPSPCDGEPVFQSAGLALCPTPDDAPSETTAHNLRRRFERIRRRAGASILLSRHTANNLRISQLETIFPTARYVHLVRDGHDVERNRPAHEPEELQTHLAAIDPSRVFLLHFEELLADPLRNLERVLRFLGVDALACYRAAIRSLKLRPANAHE